MEHTTALGFFRDFLACFVSLLPIVNPPSVMPLFLSLTRANEREEVAWRVARNAVIIMFISLFFGSAILSFFNISIGALRLSGGLVLAFLGFRMLFPDERPKPKEDPVNELGTIDNSLVPLAFPSLTGAGTVAVIMGWSTRAAGIHALQGKLIYLAAVSLSFLCVGYLAYLTLRGANKLTKLLGVQGINAFTRIMGLIMICIGMEFVAGGVKALALSASPQ